MLGHPGDIVAERLCCLDLRRHAGMDITVRIGLTGRVGVRGEEDPEFHAVSSLRHRFSGGPAHNGALHGTLPEAHCAGWCKKYHDAKHIKRPVPPTAPPLSPTPRHLAPKRAKRRPGRPPRAQRAEGRPVRGKKSAFKMPILRTFGNDHFALLLFAVSETLELLHAV